MMDYSKTHVIRSADDPSLFVGRTTTTGPYGLFGWRFAYCFDSDDNGLATASNVADGLPADEFGTLEVVLTDLHGNEVA